jgi:hypothetical protein
LSSTPLRVSGVSSGTHSSIEGVGDVLATRLRLDA